MTFYVTMVAAGYAVEIIFGVLGHHPDRAERHGARGVDHLELHDLLNLAFLALAAVLVVRFLRTGGPSMLRMMKQPAGHHS